MSTPTKTSALLSIGDLADATGVPVETLRMWERRYGHPASMRLPSGHRRYAMDQVRWVRRVAEAVARGIRPSRVMRASADEVDAMIRVECAAPPEAMDGWIAAARALDAAAFAGRLDREAEGRTTVAFVRDVVAPMLGGIGRAWVEGQLDVRHEHFVSHVVADHLRARRARAAASPGGPRVVLATLPEERHALGLEMAATVAADAGANCTLLGADTPIPQTAAAAAEVRADAVALSVSVANGGIAADRIVKQLRDLLPPGVRLFVGGAGTRRPRRAPRGIEYLEDFDAFQRILRGMRHAGEPGRS